LRILWSGTGNPNKVTPMQPLLKGVLLLTGLPAETLVGA
jgi:hypothetical protein